MSTESPETILNQASETVERAPAAEYVPMGDAYAEPPKKEKTFSGDVEGLKQAAREVTERGRDDETTIERGYIDYSTGEPMPANQTISLERASDDLTRQRNFEAQEAENATKEALATGVDLIRAGWTPEQIQQASQAEQERRAQQPQQEAQPEITPQPQSELPPEVAELAQELERSPKLKAALTEEAQRIQQAHQVAEQARQSAFAAVQQAHQVALSFTVGNFPELAGLTQEQIPAALHVLEHSNPQRFQQVVSQLAKLDQVSKANQAVQAHQQRQSQQQLAQWVQQQDAEFEKSIANESPETVRAVKSNVVRVAKEVYGIDEGELRALYQSNPLMRSAAFGRVMFDAVRYNLAQQSVREHRAPVPPVLRPGTSQPRSSYSDAEVAAARERFLKNPDDLRVAAAYLQAKRNARQ